MFWMLDSTFAKTALDLPAFEDACSTAVSNSRAHFSMKNAEHTTSNVSIYQQLIAAALCSICAGMHADSYHAGHLKDRCKSCDHDDTHDDVHAAATS